MTIYTGEVIKNCPFCGGPASLLYWSEGVGMGESYGVACGCKACDIMMRIGGEGKEAIAVAIDKWNRRG